MRPGLHRLAAPDADVLDRCLNRVRCGNLINQLAMSNGSAEVPSGTGDKGPIPRCFGVLAPRTFACAGFPNRYRSRA